MSMNCLRQTYLVPNLRLVHRLQKKRLRETRVGQNAVQKVLSRLFLRVDCFVFYIAGFWSNQWLIFHLFAGDAETIPGVSENEDVATGVATDGQLKVRDIVFTRSLVPLAGGAHHDAPEAAHSRGRSRELLARAFDDGNFCVQFRNLLELFHVDSNFLPLFVPFRSVRHRSCCHCNSCHWSSDGVLVSPHL